METRCLPNEERKKDVRAVHDALDVLNGKWKMHIITLVCYYNKRKFSDILKDVNGISNRMLSKELKELELNKLITRTVLDTHPITVEYQLTQYGKTLQTIIDNLSEWGKEHRRIIIGK
jgi:DNA-binding HxlR family transcriptional regulator